MKKRKYYTPAGQVGNLIGRTIPANNANFVDHIPITIAFLNFIQETEDLINENSAISMRSNAESLHINYIREHLCSLVPFQKSISVYCASEESPAYEFLESLEIQNKAKSAWNGNAWKIGVDALSELAAFIKRLPKLDIKTVAEKESRYIPEAIKQHALMEFENSGRICPGYIGQKPHKLSTKAQIEFDHITPFSLGGNHNANNIRILCKECNRRKGASE